CPNMSIEGNYVFAYLGANRLGIGFFTVKGEQFHGTDYDGGRYDGTARENADGSIALDIEVEVTAPATPVKGTAAQEAPQRRRISATMPPNFGDGSPQELRSPPDKLTVMVMRATENFAQSVASQGHLFAEAFQRFWT